MRWLPSLLVLSLLGIAKAISSSGSRLLAVVEDSDKASYSQFWKDLESRGYQLSFENPKSENVALFRHGQLSYDHLILTPSQSKGLGPKLTPKFLLDFTNAGGNILLALSANTPTPTAITSLLLELDIHTAPDRNSVVVDHFNYDAVSSPEKHDVLLVTRPPPLRSDVRNFFSGAGVLAFPNTVGQTLGSSSSMLAPIIKAPETSYTHNPKEEGEAIDELFASGKQLALVSSLQARNSARFTVLGSAEALQNKWFGAGVKGPDGKSVKTVNQDFAKQLTQWTFKEVGVLRAGKIDHHLISATDERQHLQVGYLNDAVYRIKNDVTFSIELSEYADDHWIPFTVPENDAVQVEFSMLSPFHRLPLSPISTTANLTIFSTNFTVPDQHGIFTFRVNYKRPFLTNIDEKRSATVRHFAHDEWPRSWRITGGWVWIAGLWSVIGGFLAFVALWLYCEPSKETPASKTR